MKKYLLFTIIVLCTCAVFSWGFLYTGHAQEDPLAAFESEDIHAAEQTLKSKYPGVEFAFDSSVHDWYKYLLVKSLGVVPDIHVKNLKRLAIEGNNLPSRGMVSFSLKNNNASVKLRFNSVKFPMEKDLACDSAAECLRITKDKVNRSFVGVVVHEMGHVIDLGESTKGTVASGIHPKYKDGKNAFFKDDPTINGFYTLCYGDEHTLNDECNPDDFVSDYAKTDGFEDFAESTAVYILDGRNFKEIALENLAAGSDKLLKKYNFFKDTIFEGKEFHGTDTGFRNSFATFDSTKRKFSMLDILTF